MLSGPEVKGVFEEVIDGVAYLGFWVLFVMTYFGENKLV
jgi:hypothetical protein